MGYLDLGIRALHEAYLRGETTPREVAEEAIRRAKESKDNALEATCYEEALSFASSLEECEKDNLLWGVPYFAKDNFSTEGVETTASSNILKGYVPVFDAEVVRRLKEKKAVLLGKTTLDELAMGGTGTSGHLGKTYNPWDESHRRMVGGSSCGSAALVAAGAVPFALGSDTGDSVRKPAGYAGLVGIKPTWGRISRFGLFPFAPSLDAVGYFTRSVDDAAILLEAIAGRDEKDATSSEKSVDSYANFRDISLEGMKVAVLDDLMDTIRERKIARDIERLLSCLEKRGVEVRRVRFGEEMLRSIYITYFVISCAEATSNDANLDGIKFGPYPGGNTYEEVMAKARTQGFGELIKRRFVIGSYSLMRENQEELFLRAQRNRAKIVGRTNEILEECDFILTPAAPGPAPFFDEQSDRLSDAYLIADNHLALGNFAGLPSITLPLSFEEGLPLGANLTGRPFDEKRLFALSSLLEEETGLRNLSVRERKEGSL